MVDRALVAAKRPLQRICGHCAGKRQTVVDARFDLCRLFIIVPRHQLKIRKRFPSVVHAVELGKCFQPGLAALLFHDAVRSPGRQRVVESFISCPNRLLAWMGHARVVEAGQVTHSIISGRRHHPRIAAIGENVGESAVILKNKCRMRTHRRVGCVPVNRRIGKIDAKICNHRLSLYRHVGRRREVRVLDVLQVVD